MISGSRATANWCGDQAIQREKNDFEQSAKRMPEEVDPFSLPGWLLRGAIRENDYARAFGRWVAPNPQNDPDSPQAFWRMMNHFYDPVYDRPLTLSFAEAGLFNSATGESTNFHRAPDWAIGVQDAFAQSPVPEEGRRNHFTVQDAREAMYRALTGKNKDNQDVALIKDDRNKYWATLFRALGDVVHLVQDMGQPQHTRNETHPDLPGYGDESFYEAYIDCRAAGKLTKKVKSYEIGSCDPLTYEGYATPVFTKYSDYFSTRDGQGRGLSDYSNRNFFSYNTLHARTDA